MAPEWWIEAQLHAEENHDASEYGGREWDQLSIKEQEEAVLCSYDLLLGSVGGS